MTPRWSAKLKCYPHDTQDGDGDHFGYADQLKRFNYSSPAHI